MKDEPKLGKVIDDLSPQRDAIHIALAPVIAGEDLKPGDHVGLLTRNQVSKGISDKIGIVDPFIKSPIKKGDKIWIMLYPNTITSLRHNWSHPAFSDDHTEEILDCIDEMGDKNRWLRAFAEKWNFNYDDMIEEAQSKEGYVVADGIDLHSASELDPGDEDEFWRQMERLTGKKFDREHRENFGWSCSC